MVERMLCMHEAQGSIPCSSITFFFLRVFFFFFFFFFFLRVFFFFFLFFFLVGRLTRADVGMKAAVEHSEKFE